MNPTTFFNYQLSTPQLPCNEGRKTNIECFVEMTDKYFESKFGVGDDRGKKGGDEGFLLLIKGTIFSMVCFMAMMTDAVNIAAHVLNILARNIIKFI